MAVTNSELPQESPICNFSCPSPENPDSSYLNVVGIPSSPKRTITKKIDFLNYEKMVRKVKTSGIFILMGGLVRFSCHFR